jgi:hypothetical protein
MVRVGVGVGVGVGVAVGVGVVPIAPAGSPIAVGVGDGLGVGIRTPLFHTSFFPLLMQVYFLPMKVEVCPAFLHTPPALTAAVALKGIIRAKTRVSASRVFFIGSVST